MKKRLFSFLLIGVILVGLIPSALAEVKDGYVTFNANAKMVEENFDVDQIFDGLEPGDVRSYNVHLTNSYPATTRWYMSNEVLKTLEENGIKKLLYKCIPHVYHLQPAEEDEYALFAAGARLCAMGASTALDLKAPIKMPKGRKAQISRAKREGVEIERRTDKESFEAFIALENEVLGARHNVKAVHTADELYLLYSRFPENIALYAALKEGHIIAGCVCFIYKETVHVQYMAADEEARRIGALDLAVASVMETYAADHKWLDFGISTEDGGKYLNEGLISQKEGFGGRTNVYRIWELDI